MCFPTTQDTEQALERLKSAESEFNRCLEARDGKPNSIAGKEFEKASRAYRMALLDPHLPPVA